MRLSPPGFGSKTEPADPPTAASSFIPIRSQCWMEPIKAAINYGTRRHVRQTSANTSVSRETTSPFIWTNGSRILSSTLLGLPYFIGVGALMISLGFLGIALSRGPVWMTISDIVQFDTGEATVTETGEQILVQVAGDIRRFRARRVEIIGYADSRGREESNQDLSEARARAVAAYLRDADTGASFVTIGKGEEEAEEIEKGSLGRSTQEGTGLEPQGRVPDHTLTGPSVFGGYRTPVARPLRPPRRPVRSGAISPSVRTFVIG